MTALHTLDADAVAWSDPVVAGRTLVIALHGYGFDETHLFGLRHHLAPGLTVASLRGPHAQAGGHAWFPNGGTPIGEHDAAVVNSAVDVVLDWIDSLDVTGPIGLLGFSQGAAMSVQLLRRRPGRFSWAVALGGYVVRGDEPGDAELARTRPPVFWGRGAFDVVIPQPAVRRTADYLRGHSTLDERIYPGLGHVVAGDEIVDAAAFIADQTRGD